MSHLQTSVAAVYPRTQPMAPLKEGNHILLPANAAVVMRLIASVCVYIYIGFLFLRARPPRKVLWWPKDDVNI